ncbi:phosphatidate cytidylyltransferase [Pseudomonas corrugata]|uniref:Phosphatidate cytidylyltransferase n=1 Tax=Pseudomonas corrugata TaxID=47879 RepID=A0A3M3EZ78_9PSED|nr:phosphatidate cytidylyltransferase [Pseudomonas corrugata]AOE64168.1 phosphatidate cytidylyltransferase [Pseudomonas corrugata]MDU9022336.1 phosphatidate cytidylyltransferase [Pseudomonas corrugata]MDU9034101.1 phosphatidate cytidylyltransferase [Pseudomonas corrugata]MDU9038633.1 phosphatidate cytidylyltransferase [Pseudomonas corrugata]QTH15450.1 phosphatidate cytidylyltransferase [Pseudomonas corrugata]
MLKQRIITALILLPIALGGFFLLDGAGFALFIGLVVTLGAWEWARLAGFAAQSARVIYAAVVAAMLFVMYVVPGIAPWVLGASVLWWATATFLVLTYPHTTHHWSNAATKLLIGLLILLPAWQGLIWIKQGALGNWQIMAVMVLVWGADVGAYFSGKAFGKRKLAPKVSPGKSWEGVYGGLALSLVITTIVGVMREWTAGQLLIGLFGAALIVFVSVVGDLTESMFKRQSGIKDSSNLLPGHGGVLDRIDSLTAAVPIFAVLLWMAAS